MMSPMERQWVRLGEKLADARRARQPRLTQDAVLRHLDISRTTLQRIERGRPPYKKVQPVHRAYARLVGWTEDSIEHVLDGGDPKVALEPAPKEEPEARPASSIATTSGRPSDLSLRVLQALTEGPLIDSQVITVPTDSGEVRAAIVVRGEPDATPEELHEQLLAWRDRERGLRRHDGDEEADR